MSECKHEKGFFRSSFGQGIMCHLCQQSPEAIIAGLQAELANIQKRPESDMRVLEGILTEKTNNGVRLGLVLVHVTGDSAAIPVGQRLRLTIERL